MAYIGQAPTKVPLTSADITDGTIALADMAVNSIDSDQYVDGSIDTAHIATNQIDETLVKDAFVGDFSDVTVTAADAFLYGDATDSGNTKKDTVQGILDLAGGGIPAVGCMVYKNSDTTISSAWLKINLNTEAFDIGSDYDNSTNYRFDVPTTGKYIVSIWGSFTSIAANTDCHIGIIVDGSQVDQTQTEVAYDGIETLNVTRYYSLNSGQNVAMQAYAPATVTFKGSANHWYSGMFIQQLS